MTGRKLYTCTQNQFTIQVYTKPVYCFPSSRGKMALVDPRQQQITTFFNKSAEETGKLESEDRLNLESDNAGQTSAAAGVGIPQSEVGPSRESE